MKELKDMESVTIGSRTLEAWFESAISWRDYLATVVKHRDLWVGVWERAAVPTDIIEEFGTLDKSVRLLALSEDWCGDASNLLPVIARLAEHLGWELRVLLRDQNLELMDGYLTDGRSRSIPVVIAIDEDGQELGWWGPRPTDLQKWVLGPGQEFESPERYKRTRTWYARDRGRTAVREFLSVVTGQDQGAAP